MQRHSPKQATCNSTLPPNIVPAEAHAQLAYGSSLKLCLLVETITVRHGELPHLRQQGQEGLAFRVAPQRAAQVLGALGYVLVGCSSRWLW
jgi:hypothetical protein